MIAEFIDPAILGFILVGVMLFAIFVGFPISFTLIFLGFVFGYLGFGKLVFYLMTLQQTQQSYKERQLGLENRIINITKNLLDLGF